MARKKKADTMLHNDKKMETVLDFGNIKVPTKWEEVTLQMLSDYLTLSHEKEEALKKDKLEAKKNKQEAPNEKDEKYTLTDKDILKIFTNFDISKYDILPVELYESIMSNFAFLIEDMPVMKPSNELYYNNIHFVINFFESLKVKEYEDADMVLRNNPYDYPSLLAILCRECKGKKTDHITGQTYLINEDYDTEFANHIFDARRDMFAKMPMTKVMPLVNFFFYERSRIQQSFSKLYFDDRPPIKRSCGEYARFAKQQGFRKMVISAADDKVEKIQEIHRLYLTEFLEYCTYELDHAYAEKAQMDWEEQQRKLKRH